MNSPHNIYPFNLENIKALISFHKRNVNFDTAGLNFITKYADFIDLDDLNTIIKIVNANTNFFATKLGAQNLKFSNMLQYGIDAFLKDFRGGSSSRNQITRDFSIYFHSE